MTSPFHRQELEHGLRPVSGETVCIDAATYCDLAISARTLERIADTGQGVVGFRDLETGEQFMLESKTLVGYGLSVATK